MRRVHRDAFARAGEVAGDPPEVALLAELRRSADWIPRLSLVADRADDEVVGHVVCTRARIGADHPVLALGPTGVRPAIQGMGVGHALVHAVLAAAEALDETMVGVLGDAAFYRRFGFQPARGLGIRPQQDAWAEHFQVRFLATRGEPPTGRFRYPAPFDAF